MRKPFTGTILGVLMGVAIASFLARQGIWPADQLTLFFVPAVLGFVGLAMLSAGRPSKGTATLVISLLVLVPMLVWGALGFLKLSGNGELNGGCMVSATSDLDSTTVTDTSRGDPFEIDPDGGLTWSATSPEAFMDYDWELHAVFGGIPISIESGHEANEAGDTENGGDVDDVRAYAADRGIDLDLYVGVYEVGGSAATCDGFAFVRIVGDGMDTIALISLIAAITFFVILIVLTFVGRGAGATSETVVAESGAMGVTDGPDTAGETGPGQGGAPVDDAGEVGFEEGETQS
jgi:hypothetical protein